MSISHLDKTGLTRFWGAIKTKFNTVDTRLSALESSADANTTYSISISSGVITLTGSDGSTSTVTLPVYNGGVT